MYYINSNKGRPTAAGSPALSTHSLHTINSYHTNHNILYNISYQHIRLYITIIIIITNTNIANSLVLYCDAINNKYLMQ